MSLTYVDAEGESQEILLSEVEDRCEDGTLVESTQVYMDGLDGWTDFSDAMDLITAKLEQGVTMITYVADDDEQIEANVSELPGLVSEGKIQDDTLIYHDGLSEWTAFSEIKESLIPASEGSGETDAAEDAHKDPGSAQAEPDIDPEDVPEEEPDPAVSEGVPPEAATDEATEEQKAAAAHAEAALAAEEKARKDKERAEVEKKAAEDAAAAVDVESPVFQGKLRAMVADGLPESHSSRCLVACGGNLERATELLSGVMESIGAAASMQAMSDEELYAKVDEVMAEIDTFKAGSISFRQFLSWIKRQSGQKRLSDEMNARGQELFNKFDHDDACCLDREKMKNCLMAMEKDAMFGSVMESLMAEKMAELEAAIAVAEEEAKAAAAEAAEAAAEAAAAEAAAAEAKAKAEAEAAAAKAAQEKAAAEAKAAEEAAAAAKAAGDAEAAAKAAEEAAAAKAAQEKAEAEKAAVEAARLAALEEAKPLDLAVDCAGNNLVYDPVDRTLTFDEDIEAFTGAKLKEGVPFALSGLGDADGVYTVLKSNGCSLTVVEELPCISADLSHEWIPGADVATVTEGTVKIQTGSAACSKARRKQQKSERKDLLPAYRRLDGEHVVNCLKESDLFTSEMEEMTCDFIEFQLGSVKIPPIEGTQDWGSYNIDNLGLKSYEVLPENVHMTHVGSQHLLPSKRDVKLGIGNIEVRFDEFSFGFDKTAFPKLKEEGATAKIEATFNASVMFKISCSQTGGLVASDVRAGIEVEETPIEVLQGKHKKLYNMLLKAFSERVKTTIQEQLTGIIAASTSILKLKLEEKFRLVADDILLDLIMPNLEEQEEKAVRNLFNSLDKRKRGRLDDKMIGELLKQLGQWTTVLPQKVQATRIEINEGNEDEETVELDQFLEWWKKNATDETHGPTAALICSAMGRKPDGMSPGLAGALKATRLKIGRPEPLSRPPS